MSATGNRYKKNEDWRKIAYIGSGVAGKCYLAVDLRTEAQFAVKKVCAAWLEARNLCVVLVFFRPLLQFEIFSQL